MNTKASKWMKNYTLILGYMLPIALSIVMIITFITAYNTNTKTTLVSINTYGEAQIELLLIIVIIIICAITAPTIIRKITKE